MESNNKNTNEDDFFDDDADDELLAAAEAESQSESQSEFQSESQAESSKSTSITSAQKNRAEKNRMKALALKKARLIANPYPTPKSKEDFVTGEKISKVNKNTVPPLDQNTYSVFPLLHILKKFRSHTFFFNFAGKRNKIGRHKCWIFH